MFVVVGSATRTCIKVDTWSDLNVLDCLPVEYQNYLNQVFIEEVKELEFAFDY